MAVTEAQDPRNEIEPRGVQVYPITHHPDGHPGEDDKRRLF